MLEFSLVGCEWMMEPFPALEIVLMGTLNTQVSGVLVGRLGV